MRPTSRRCRRFRRGRWRFSSPIERGHSNADITKQLSISVDVVKEHIKLLLTKLGAANRTEAVSIALRKHLL